MNVRLMYRQVLNHWFGISVMDVFIETIADGKVMFSCPAALAPGSLIEFVFNGGLKRRARVSFARAKRTTAVLEPLTAADGRLGTLKGPAAIRIIHSAMAQKPWSRKLRGPYNT